MKKVFTAAMIIFTLSTASMTTLAAPSPCASKDQATCIALKDTGYDEEDTLYTYAKKVFVNGKEAYTVEFRVGFVEYEYVIDSANSAVISTVVND